MPGTTTTSPDTLELTLREGQGKELVRPRQPNQQIHIAIGPEAAFDYRAEGIEPRHAVLAAERLQGGAVLL